MKRNFQRACLVSFVEQSGNKFPVYFRQWQWKENHPKLGVVPKCEDTKEFHQDTRTFTKRLWLGSIWWKWSGRIEDNLVTFLPPKWGVAWRDKPKNGCRGHFIENHKQFFPWIQDSKGKKKAFLASKKLNKTKLVNRQHHYTRTMTEACDLI